MLPIILLVVPVLAAFASKGWDLRATAVGDLGPLEDLTSGEPEVEVGEFGLLENLDSFRPSYHYVISWENAESKLISDLGQVIGYVDLGNAGSHAGHAPTKDIPGFGCAGCTIPDYDDADPNKDCVNPNDGIAPVFEFSASPGSFAAPLPMNIPPIVGRDDPTNAVVVRSSIDAIEAAFINAGWEFYRPCEGFMSPEPHTPIGEVADAFLDEGEYQYHIRIFYGGHDSTYGDWYYMGAHYEGQNSVPAVGVPVNFTNPYSFSITVENVFIDVFCASDNYRLGQGRLQQETVVRAESSGSINIIIGITYEGFNHLLNNHLVGTSIDTSLTLSGTVQLDVYGLTATAPFEESAPFPSIEVSS